MKSVVITLVAASALLASCENKTGTGALVGGILGAGAGAGIGAAISGGSGAAIGAGAGAVCTETSSADGCKLPEKLKSRL